MTQSLEGVSCQGLTGSWLRAAGDELMNSEHHTNNDTIECQMPWRASTYPPGCSFIIDYTQPSVHGTKMRPHGSRSLFCDKLERPTPGKLYVCPVGELWRATCEGFLALQEAWRGTEACLQMYWQAFSLSHPTPPS